MRRRRPVGEELSDTIALTAGFGRSAALKADGTFVIWGSSTGYEPPELGVVTSLGLGQLWNVALQADGTVAAWGDNATGNTTMPGLIDRVFALSVGDQHTAVLRDASSDTGVTITTPARQPDCRRRRQRYLRGRRQWRASRRSINGRRMAPSFPTPPTPRPTPSPG